MGTYGINIDPTGDLVNLNYRNRLRNSYDTILGARLQSLMAVFHSIVVAREEERYAQFHSDEAIVSTSSSALHHTKRRSNM
jgi:hypothetical protein